MAGKQLKIALSDDFYQHLQKEAKKNKLPVSSYARNLMAKQLEMAPSNDSASEEEPVIVTNNPQSKEDLILLSDILEDGAGASEENIKKSSSKGLEINHKDKGVQININFN